MPPPPTDTRILMEYLLTLLERVLDSIHVSPRLKAQIEQQARYEVPFLLFGNADEMEE